MEDWIPPTPLIRDLSLTSLLVPMTEENAKVLTAVDKFEVARRMPKSYTKTHVVRKHIASHQHRDNEWAVFTSKVEKCGKVPWANYQNTDFEDPLNGVTKYYNRHWESGGKIPAIPAAPRFEDEVSGANLKRFMKEQIVVQAGCGSDSVVGVTNPQLVQYLRIQQKREWTEGQGVLGKSE